MSRIVRSNTEFHNPPIVHTEKVCSGLHIRQNRCAGCNATIRSLEAGRAIKLNHSISIDTPPQRDRRKEAVPFSAGTRPRIVLAKECFMSRCFMLWHTSMVAVFVLAIATTHGKAQDELELTPVQSEKPTEVIRERFPDGTVKIEREVTQDEKENYINHGKWKMFNQRGTLLAEGQYVNNKRDGTWVRFYQGKESKLFSEMPYKQFKGPYVSQATFKDGQLHGTWKIYDASQHKISEFSLSEGQRNGKSTWWYANGQKMREIDFRDGLIDGRLMEWTPNKKLVTNNTYQSGRKLALKVTKYKNGAKKTEGMFLYAKLVVETPDDWWNATVAQSVAQGQDERHGTWTSWYENGQEHVTGNYENDVPVGTFTWSYKTGQKALVGNYKDGQRHGFWDWWHPNGQKATYAEYKDDQPVGRWLWWSDDGKVSEIANLDEGTDQSFREPKLPPEDVAQQPKSDEPATLQLRR